MRGRHALRSNPPCRTSPLELGNGKRIDTFKGNRLVIAFDLEEVMPQLVAEEGVCAECVEVHIATHGDELGAGKVVEG